MDYTGKIITKNAVTPTQTAASGVWTLDDALQAQKANNWPIPGVPNPISKSLRFNSADSAYLNRTPTIQGNRRTWTWSAWVKRSQLGAGQFLFEAGAFGVDTATGRFVIRFNSNDTFLVTRGGTSDRVTTQVFRDVSSWYHIVVAVDTTQATANNRIKIYVNGSQVTDFSSIVNPNQNDDTAVNSTTIHTIGRTTVDNGAYLNGYMTETYLIDGQALTPSDFGMSDINTGVWIPKKYTGTYGTNGFYVNFKDATNTTTLGLDYSGNGNNWNANNFSVTAGAGNDSLTDVPTPWVAYNTTGDVGGVVRGNYATWNPLKNTQSAVLTNGNLDLSTAGSPNRTGTYTTIGASTGKWYWEITAGSLSTDGYNIGIANSSKLDTALLGADTNSYIYINGGTKRTNGTTTSYGATYTSNDVIGVALDLDNGTLTFYKNGSSQGTAFTSIPSETWFPVVCDDATGSTTGSSFIANFGQRPFAYTAPSGFKALCTTNLPTPAIGATASSQANKYMNIALYNGNSSTQAITGVGFQPDLVWIKPRNTASYGHKLFDAVRGATKFLASEATDAEGTISGLTSFDSDGFTLGSYAGTNGSSYNHVAWNWKANGAGVTNTDGQITSTVSANTTAGFSIVTFTTDGTTKTVGHGLGVKPSIYIVKSRSAAGGWLFITDILGSMQYGALNTTGAFSSISYSAPTSTVFQYNDNNGVTQVAYCFAEVAGYSKFGSYTGNGSTDGPFVYTGFRPAYVMIKCSSSFLSPGNADWRIMDAKRNTYNVEDKILYANLSNAEDTVAIVDFLSNGFKLRQISYSNVNAETYIYAAFAESPFKFSNAR